MNNLDKYVEEIKDELKIRNIEDELEIIKFVYLDLGKNFSFDIDYLPFGNNKTRNNIYKYHCRNIDDLNKCMDNKLVICKSVSYILEYVLSNLGINIKTLKDELDTRKTPHVFNLIKTSDGRKFCVDLQKDMYNIQTHSFTSNFGLKSIYNTQLAITRSEQEKIDRKLGYITKDNYYSDDYLYLLHSIADSIDDFKTKAEFIIENIDIYPTKKMGYMDRQWHHVDVLKEFFNSKEFDYEYNSGKIKIYDCYKDINGVRKNINFITVLDKNDTTIYVYNEKKSKFCKIEIDNWFNCINHGLNIRGKTINTLRPKIYNKV